MERTLVIIKPDAIQRGLIGTIISRFENKGMQVIGCKLMQITDDISARHYTELADKPFYPRIREYMTDGPSIIMVLQGPKAINIVRTVMGSTFGDKAQPGTIRGDFSNGGFNLVHGSDSPESASREIALFFSPQEIIDYPMANQLYLYGNDPSV